MPAKPAQEVLLMLAGVGQGVLELGALEPVRHLTTEPRQLLAEERGGMANPSTGAMDPQDMHPGVAAVGQGEARPTHSLWGEQVRSVSLFLP